MKIEKQQDDKVSIKDKMKEYLESTTKFPSAWPEQVTSLNHITNNYVYDIQSLDELLVKFNNNISVIDKRNSTVVEGGVSTDDIKKWLSWYGAHRWYNNCTHNFAVDCFIGYKTEKFICELYEKPISHEGDIKINKIAIDVKLTTLPYNWKDRGYIESEKHKLIQDLYTGSAVNEREVKQKRIYLIVDDLWSKSDLIGIKKAIDDYVSNFQEIPIHSIEVKGEENEFYCELIKVSQSEEFCEVRNSLIYDETLNNEEERIQNYLKYNGGDKKNSFFRLWGDEETSSVYVFGDEQCEQLKNGQVIKHNNRYLRLIEYCGTKQISDNYKGRYKGKQYIEFTPYKDGHNFSIDECKKLLQGDNVVVNEKNYHLVEIKRYSKYCKIGCTVEKQKS